MGKKWDYDVPSKEVWQECLRVLKPGGYLLSFAGTRTQHRMAVNIEDAGFEIRDMIAWVYGSGFPKSLNIGKAIDKLQGNEREEVGGGQIASQLGGDRMDGGKANPDYQYTKGNSEYEGWGTALKPALEPITVARKPLAEKTVAENVLKWGTGGINIDESRVGTEGARTNSNGKRSMYGGNSLLESKTHNAETVEHDYGRFPANLIHDGSDEVVSLFPNTKGGTAVRHNSGGNTFGGENTKPPMEDLGYGDEGSAARFFKNVETKFLGIDAGSFVEPFEDQVELNSKMSARFFYCAKASKADRDEGLEGFEEEVFSDRNPELDSADMPQNRSGNARKNHHPTVKPTKLMQYLVKLVTPKGGTCLDPFMGSGSTGKACKLEGFDFIGIEMDADYIAIAKARIEAVNTLFRPQGGE